MLGELPELPTRDSFEPLMPENTDFDDDDDVMLAPNEIERPFSNATPILEGKFD